MKVSSQKQTKQVGGSQQVTKQGQAGFSCRIEPQRFAKLYNETSFKCTPRLPVSVVVGDNQLKYLLLTLLFILPCVSIGAKEFKCKQDSTLELKITEEIDRICKILGFERKGEINDPECHIQNGYEVYESLNVNILTGKDSLRYTVVFFILKGKIVLRNFVLYRGSLSSEKICNTEVAKDIKKEIVKAVSIFAEQVKINFYDEPKIFETQNYYFAKFYAHEPTLDMVTFMLSKDMKVVGVYHGA